MRSTSNQHQPEKILHFLSFNQKDEAALQEIISILREAGTSVVVGSESQAILNHYVREIGSNFLDKGRMMGDIKRGPTDRAGIIASINRALSKSKQKAETSAEHCELWIYYANATDDLSTVHLAQNLVRQVRDCNISIAIVCSAIVGRSNKFHSWLKKVKIPKFNFERPSRQDMDDYLSRAEANGSINLARSLLRSIDEGRANPSRDVDLIDFTHIQREERTKHKVAAIVPDRSQRPGTPKEGSAAQRQGRRGNRKPWKIGSYFGIFVLTILCPSLLAAVLFDSENWLGLKALVLEADPFDGGLVSTTKSKGKDDTNIEVEKQKTSNGQSAPPTLNKSTTEAFIVRSATPFEPKDAIEPNTVNRVADEVIVNAGKSQKGSPILQVENLVVPTKLINGPVETVSRNPEVPPTHGENLKYLQYGAFVSESSARRLMRLEHYDDAGFFVAQKKNGLWAVLSGPYDDNRARELIENSERSNAFFMVREEDVQTNSNPRHLGNG